MSFKNAIEKVVASQKLSKDVTTSICRNCGFPLSASFTKSQLIDEISNGLQQPSLFYQNPIPTKKQKFNVLSIDMGIKNFSYCKLQIDALKPFDKPVVVKEWRKLNLLNWTNNPLDLEFCPENYSKIANDVVFKLILSQESQSPDLILIERQRFRSMRSATVLETVIRSGVLENMIFASLNTLKSYDKKFQFLLKSSSPLIMTSYWESYKTSDKQRYDKLDQAAKKHRIDLVSNWILNSGKNIVIPSIDENSRLKIAKIKNHSRRLFEIVNTLNGTESMKVDSEKQKGDDLADSLLHAITWLDFENNKQKFRQVLNESPDLLLDELQKIEAIHVKEINEIRDLYNN